jgi:hypothetical protein
VVVRPARYFDAAIPCRRTSIHGFCSWCRLRNAGDRRLEHHPPAIPIRFAWPRPSLLVAPIQRASPGRGGRWSARA